VDFRQGGHNRTDVTPADAGVQLNWLDSGIRRNDEAIPSSRAASRRGDPEAAEFRGWIASLLRASQ
jgi:hypothetical protein